MRYTDGSTAGKGQPMTTEPEYFNAVEAAEYLGVIRQRVYDLAKEGRIGRRIGGYWLFTKEELDRYAAERTQRPKGGFPKDNAGK